MKYQIVKFETIGGTTESIFIYDDANNLIKTFPKLETNEAYQDFVANIDKYEAI